MFTKGLKPFCPAPEPDTEDTKDRSILHLGSLWLEMEPHRIGLSVSVHICPSFQCGTSVRLYSMIM